MKPDARSNLIFFTTRQLRRSRKLPQPRRVVIDQEGNQKGSRFFGAIAGELRQFNLTKRLSLAP